MPSCEQVLEAVAGIFSLLAAAVEAKLTSGKAFFKQLDGKEQARKVIAKQLEELLISTNYLLTTANYYQSLILPTLIAR